jgi:hypothetical protein
MSASRITSSASLRRRELAVRVHHARQELRIERAPVHADAHGLAVLDRLLDHRRELVVALRAVADVARVDAVLVEHDRALRHLREELVAVEVEVADERDLHVHRVEAPADLRHWRAASDGVHGDAHDLGARARELATCSAVACAFSVVRVRHGLHEDGRGAADDLVGHADGA